MTKRYYSNGKLLISGEYVVLDGALSLALPTTYGQFLEVAEIETPVLKWKSLDLNGVVWFEWMVDLVKFQENPSKIELDFAEPKVQQIANTLLTILIAARELNPHFLNSNKGYSATTKLTFPRDWGLGSSSTLLNNIAQWAGIDAYQLLWRTMGGSGYDIACAKHNRPILYTLKKNNPIVEEIPFNPPFKEQLYFVYLNQKQSSADGILNYSALNFDKQKAISEISDITKEMVSCMDAMHFSKLMDSHEMILSTILGRKTVKELLFPRFPGAIKSLGAWGGDFIMVLGNKNTTAAHFKGKNHPTVLTYAQMVL